MINRKKLFEKTLILQSAIFKLWADTYRVTPANQAIADWYTNIRLDYARLDERQNLGMLDETQLREYAERLVVFALVVIQLDGIVVSLPPRSEALQDQVLDAAEDLGASL